MGTTRISNKGFDRAYIIIKMLENEARAWTINNRVLSCAGMINTNYPGRTVANYNTTAMPRYDDCKFSNLQ